MNDGKFAGWRKSSHSGDGNSCVEVAIRVSSASQARGVGLRDTQQDGRGPVLELGRAVWAEFIARVKNPLSLGDRPPSPVMMSGGRSPWIARRVDRAVRPKPRLVLPSVRINNWDVR